MLVQVPAVILVCRNSTDTAYFQRLRPYPRIMLLRYNTRFKDYVRPPHSCLHLGSSLVPHAPYTPSWSKRGQSLHRFVYFCKARTLRQPQRWTYKVPNAL